MQGVGTSGTAATDVQLSQVITTSPPIDFSVRTLHASKSGRYLAVTGYDEEVNMNIHMEHAHECCIDHVV